MSKREAASASGVETVEDVCSFIGGICPEMYRENAMMKIRENEIDGKVLRSMSEAELRSELGIDKFGPRRKLYLRISEVFQNGPEKQGLRASSKRAATSTVAQEACAHSSQARVSAGTNVSTETQAVPTGSRRAPAAPDPCACVATVSVSALKPPADGVTTDRSKEAVDTTGPSDINLPALESLGNKHVRADDPSGTAAREEVATLNISVKDQEHNEVYFRIKYTTPLGKVFQAFARKRGVDERNLGFLFDGNRLSYHYTAQNYNMEDGDEIYVCVQQSGD
mmetsp:Transcript_26180/g.43819  ORF Transcript_26180/g.43819 Transcript_26180/m.43819 type:complete len:281 (+) Transcript_26180:161-1003(+)